MMISSVRFENTSLLAGFSDIGCAGKSVENPWAEGFSATTPVSGSGP
jgi:hypothetical protein